MKKRENKEILKKIKETIKKYDSIGIIINSYLIGGSEEIFTLTPKSIDTPEEIASSDVLYYTGYVSAEGISNPKKVLGKIQLINECTNKIINASFANEEVSFIESLSIKNDNDD